jgi:ribonuclease R
MDQASNTSNKSHKSSKSPANYKGPARSRGAAETREGRLTIHARGFGFVVTDVPDADVFVAPFAMSNAMHGDRVRVRAYPSPKGFDGQVIEVLERATHFVGGQLRLLGRGAFVEVDDDRIKVRVEVDGALPSGARDGQGVIAKVVEYPEQPGDALRVQVVETFDAAQLAEFEIKRVLLSNGVQEGFPDDVVAEAQAYADHVTAEDREGRVDLREVELLTIDPDDARDHDDAVWAERLPDGYRVLIAIADVSHYVREGTALDREALARGCTIYLPSRAIPMLPRELSSELASLLPRKDRLALAVEVELDRSGAVRSHRFLECVMRSAARLSYGGVARALGLTEEPQRQPGAESRLPLLQTLLEVAKLLGAHRKSRGSLDFDLPEPKVKLDPETGAPLAVEKSRSDPGVRVAYNMIEELMLLANEVVAADLSERKMAAIYRVHGAPTEEKLRAFAELARSLGFPLDADVAEKPGKLSRFLASVAGTPHAALLGYLMLRAMQQATYTTDNRGHFGLAAENYVHFTSPIRRYPDLAVHRLVRKIARGEQVRGKKLEASLQMQAAESSRLERRAMVIEREVVDLYRAILMRERIGEVFDATITGITEHGVYAAIDSPCVDVMCRATALFPDRYEVDQFGTRLYGVHSGASYALFDKLRVKIDDVSLARRRISAVPVNITEARGEQAARPAPGEPSGPPSRRTAPHRAARKHEPKAREPKAHEPKAHEPKAQNVREARSTRDAGGSRGSRDARRRAKEERRREKRQAHKQAQKTKARSGG